jgi:hypothetical protein
MEERERGDYTCSRDYICRERDLRERDKRGKDNEGIN